jgi:hypothetical protein
VTLGDADLRKFLMKMVYKNLSKTASNLAPLIGRLGKDFLALIRDREQRAGKPS